MFACAAIRFVFTENSFISSSSPATSVTTPFSKFFVAADADDFELIVACRMAVLLIKQIGNDENK